MNFKLILRITGATLLIEAATMAVPLGVALIYREDPLPFLMAIAVLLCLGLPLRFLLKSGRAFFAREGFCAVALIWVLLSAFGALPFWFSGQFGSYVDCLFETASGFTTTGSTILTAIEGLPYGLLFWRSFTHWLGGMGVLILAVALLPSLGVSSTFLIRAESPGPIASKLVPKASHSSKILYTIYLALTVLQTVLLRLAGLPWYDSLIHAMGTAGTGGFSNRNASVGAYGNPAVEIIITVFMLLFSVNFSLYFLLLCRKFKQVLKSDELRFFLIVVAAATVLIAVNIAPMYAGIGETVRTSAFQVASIISTSGFATADFNLWPEFSKIVLLILMFIGACAGSTGGGMQCARILVLMKTLRREIRTIIHPRAVAVVKLDGEAVPERTLGSIHAFFVAYMVCLFIAALVVGLDNFTLGTTLTAVVTCLSNVGPGLEAVGPMGNFAAFSPLSKLMLSLCMIVGRLEIFPMLVLFSRNAWKRS